MALSVPTLPWYGWAGLAGLFVLGVGGGKAFATEAKPGSKPAGGGPPEPPRPPGAPPLLKEGSSGPWVTYLRALLGLGAGTSFDAGVKSAVVAFQTQKGLTPDGLVGKNTWGALGVSQTAPAPSGGGGGGGVKPDFLGATGSWQLPDSIAEREAIIASEVSAGNHSLAQPDGWATIQLSANGHTGSIDVSRRTLALVNGPDRLVVNTSFNTANKIANQLGGMVLLTSKLSDEIYKQAALKLKPQTRNWVTDGSMSKTARMLQLSGELDQLVGGETGLVANEGKDWVVTARNWAPPQGTGLEAPEGTKSSRHNGANFGFYLNGFSKSPGGMGVIQSVGLAHDRKHTDYCLAEGTLVDTPLGHRPIESLAAGDLVFSYNHGRERPDCSRVAATMSTGVQPTMLVTLDNGEQVRCTTNHRWLLVDGSECVASALAPGVRLLPLRRSHAGAGYETIYSRSSHRYSYAHRAIACAAAGIPYKTRGLVTHHKDENKRNNHPDNLELKGRVAHSLEHRENVVAQWKRPDVQVALVEFDGLCVPTYDIEVERDHNFALSAGVFVHNSQQLRFAHPDSLMVDGVKRDYAEVLADPELSALLSDEGPLPGPRHPDFA